MSERPKDGADPDETVMLPAGGGARAPDEDATVMMPAARPDDDATVMMPARPAQEPDADATVMISAETLGREEPDPEATIAIPTPGRRRDTESPALPDAFATPGAGSEAAGMDPAALGGMNPLVAAANPVFAVVAQIRHALKHPDPESLRASLAQRIDAFETAARATSATDETVVAAREALCALVDESAASTPWGAAWAAGGEEKFFDRLEQYGADPEANRELLEFFYVCLALGYEGRYRQAPEGRPALAARRGKLLELLRAQRPARDGELSGRSEERRVGKECCR